MDRISVDADGRESTSWLREGNVKGKAKENTTGSSEQCSSEHKHKATHRILNTKPLSLFLFFNQWKITKGF